MKKEKVQIKSIENAIFAFINIGELKQFNKIFMFC